MVWYLPTEAAERPFVGGGGDPALHLRGQDLAHRPAAEGGEEVLVEVGPVGGQGGGLDVLGGQPDGLDVLGEGDLAAGVVVPGAVADFGFLAVGGAFGGAPGGVGAGGALPAFGVAVAGHEPFVAVVGDTDLDPRHRCLPKDSKSLMSAQCPQTLPRSSAKVGEGQRKLNVRSDLRLYPHSGSQSSVNVRQCGEADTALITQRSQVQILPPLQSETAGQRPVSGVIRAASGVRGQLVSAEWAPRLPRTLGSLGGRM